MARDSAITFTDGFCGAGGSTIGAKAAGGEAVLALNHWPLAIQTHNKYNPEATHVCTDISAVNPRRFRSTVAAIFSPECFPAGTLILAERGLVPIEAIVVGDRVLTHTGRWQPVTQTMSKIADTIIVRGHGHYGLEVTPEHPFYLRSMTWKNKRHRVLGSPGWVVAKHLTPDTLWATPTLAGTTALPIPPVEGRGAYFSNEFWWMVGKWLADGVVTLKQNGAQHIRISCSHNEVEDTYARINFNPPSRFYAQFGEFRWSREVRKQQVLLTTSHGGFGDWLTKHFGKLAHAKQIPAWALTMQQPWRQALLEGYLYGDGCYDKIRRQFRFATVSKSLAFGIRLLAVSLGYACSLQYRDEKVGAIGDKVFVARPRYTGTFVASPIDKLAVVDGQHMWFKVAEVKPGTEQQQVYNLSVAEDESYIADGIVVHNCTEHTLAKGEARKMSKQLDMWGANALEIDPEQERSRMTMWDVARFTEVHRYEFVIVENVVDVRWYWEPYPAWIQAMQLLGYNYGEVYLNSMFAHPTPQSRDRLYVVFWKSGNPAPDLAIRPWAYCPQCQENVQSIQTWKSDLPQYQRNRRKSSVPPRTGRYRKQYFYRCPSCALELVPYYHAAANAVDWSLPIQRIGDRDKPLEPKTIARIKAGLARFKGRWHPFLWTMDYTGSEGRLRGVEEPWPAQMGSQTAALGMPPLLINQQTNGYTTSVDDPWPTQLGEQHRALVVPPFIVKLRGDEHTNSLGAALSTITGGGIHHALFAPPFIASRFNGRDAVSAITDGTPTMTGTIQHHLVVPFVAQLFGNAQPVGLDDALGTFTGSAVRHGLVTPPPFVTQYNGNGGNSALDEALPTQTGNDRHAVVQPSPDIEIDINECGFRMFVPDEVREAMAFPRHYVAEGTQKQQVKQYGQAVTPPAMKLLFERCSVTLNGRPEGYC